MINNAGKWCFLKIIKCKTRVKCDFYRKIRRKRQLVECCIFDLDGTLLSTLDTITYHLNNTLREAGIPEITVEDCRSFIGDGARQLVTRACAKGGVADTRTVDRVLGVYNAAYNSAPLPYTAPYPGVTELVDALFARGVKLAVVTNKPEVTAKQLIDHFFGDRFAIVRGGREGAVLKPDPTETLSVMGELGVSSLATAFIGDTAVDITTGKNARVGICVGVSWGFRDKAELLSAGADLLVDTADGLYRELERI